MKDNASRMYGLIGKRGYVTALIGGRHPLRVPVTIVDVRSIYGQLRCQIDAAPLELPSTVWVNESSVTFDS